MAAAIVLGCVGAASANLGAGAAAQQPAGTQALDPAGGAVNVTDAGAGGGNATDAGAVPGEVAMGPTAAAVQTVTDPAAFAAVEPTYALNAGVDYSPNSVPPPAVPILDIEGGALMVADAVECAASCTMAMGCNAASYYGDNPVELWPSGQNCYLKTLTGCVLPADVVLTGDATIFMIGGPDCALAAGPVAAPVGGIAPAAAVAPNTTLAAPNTTAAAPNTTAGATGTVDPGLVVAQAPAPAVATPDAATAAAPFQDTSVAAGPAGTTDSGLDPPDQAVDSLPTVAPNPSAAPMLHMHGVAGAAAVLLAGAALMW